MDLSDIRVLDLTRLLPGPYGTQLLADMGADVIKIEDTREGDHLRNSPPITERDVNGLFDTVNRGKRSACIDLKSETGVEIFHDLVKTADVVFEQFRPGVVDRLNVDYDTISSINENIVYCSLSGYGQDGPMTDRVGHDLNYIGYAGLLDLSRGSTDQDPHLPGYTIADIGGGIFAALSILGALLSRELGDEGGEYIDVAMTDAVFAFGQIVAHQVFAGQDPRPGDTSYTGRNPWYDVYEAADGYVTIAAIEEKFWVSFCEKIDRPELIDVHGSTDPDELTALRDELEEIFAKRPTDHWDELAEEETMLGIVNTPAEAMEHPHTEAREMIQSTPGAPDRIAFPAKFGESLPTDESIPLQGEHTGEVLDGLGYDNGAIEDLLERGVIRDSTLE
jgi:alpha-methylacyl-CoA racemase